MNGSLDLREWPARIAGHELSLLAVHQEVEVFEHDGADESRVALRLDDGGEDAMAPWSWAKTPSALLRCARRPSAYLTGIGSPSGRPSRFTTASGRTSLTAPESTTPLIVSRRT